MISLTPLLFFGVLPLFNAPLDWLSFGITRGLLRSITSGGHGAVRSLLWAMADVVLALLLLFAVALTTWLGIYFMNWVALAWGGQVLIDPDELLAQLRNDGWRENLWIWMILGSTLLPTALHFLIASMAGFLALNRKRTQKIAETLKTSLAEVKAHEGSREAQAAVEVNSDAHLMALFYLYVAPMVVILVWGLLVVMVGFGLFTYLPDLVQWFLSLFGGPLLPVDRQLFWMA